MPVKIPVSISSSFGEFRVNHFHAGIDIRTGGKEGIKIYAIEDGFVSRIKISPWSYGNTIYIDHPNGYTSVYAHLKSFNSEIKKYTRQLQYNNQEFAIDIQIEKDKLPIKKGEFIGLSGNTGRSFGPHLHFEIRETITEFPVDPMQFYPQIKDNIKPRIKSFNIYSFADTNMVYIKRTKHQIYGNNGNYYLNNILNLSGYTGFGIETLDYINGSSNRCGIKAITLKIDSSIIYEFVLDKFSYYQKRYINAHLDYAYYIETKKRINKLWVEPNNKLSLYKNVINNGIYNFNNDEIHNIECLISDYRDNISKLNFKVQSKTNTNVLVSDIKNEGQEMFYNKENIFKNDCITVNLSDSVLYNNIYFQYNISEKRNGSLTPVYHIHKNTSPLHNKIDLSIKVDSIPDSLTSKLLIAHLTKRNKIISYGGKFSEGSITAQIDKFGRYFVLIDTIPPRISSQDIFEGAKFENDKNISLKITDNLSGIVSYNGFIDKKWILFEFEPKQNLIIYNFDNKIEKTETKHKFLLKVKDERGNTSIFETYFYY